MSNNLRTAVRFCRAALLTAGLFLLPAHLEAKDAKEVELRFDGRPKVGEPYVISVNTRQVRTYRMKLVGIDNPPRRRETHEIHAVGELVYQSLDPLVVQFKVEMLSQVVDGVKTDYAPLAGMTAIVRSSGVNLRDIPLGTDEDAAESVLGGGSASGASDTKKKTTKEIREMLPGARRLIGSMFAAPLDRPGEYLGKSRKVKPGEKWTASAKPMLEAIKANGLELAEDKVTATATYHNALKIQELLVPRRRRRRPASDRPFRHRGREPRDPGGRARILRGRIGLRDDRSERNRHGTEIPAEGKEKELVPRPVRLRTKKNAAKRCGLVHFKKTKGRFSRPGRSPRRGCGASWKAGRIRPR